MSLTILAVVFLALASASGSQAKASSSSATPAIARGDARRSPDTLLVRFRDAAGTRARSAVHQRARARPVTIYRSVPGLEAVALVPGASLDDALAAYQADPAVAYAEPDYIVREAALPDDVYFGKLWGLHNDGSDGGILGADIDALEAWEISTGDPSVAIAVLDGGMDYTHADLAANAYINPGDCDEDNRDDDGNGYVDDCHGLDLVSGGDPTDNRQHGTHVAGTIGAVGNNATGVAGVAHRVTLVPCKFIDTFGQGSTSNAIRCFDYVLAMRSRGVNIVATNNSWGGIDLSRALVDAIAAQREAGVLTVAAAGNSSTDADFYPASIDDPSIVSVAATTRTDELADFSSFGRANVDIGAPGADVYSTIPNTRYRSLNGTSMAAPHVTGAVALLAASDPSLDWIALRNILLSSGDSLASLSQVTVSGRRLNVHRALTCTNQELTARTHPGGVHSVVSPFVPLRLAAMHVNCGQAAGNVAVSVEPGGDLVTLLDDGTGPDMVSGDGEYSAFWMPPSVGVYTLAFPDGDEIQVDVRDSVLLSPSASVLGKFGESFAKEGDLILVGAPRDEGVGAAYLYSASGGQPLQTFTSPSPGADDLFGASVALAAGVVAVGAPFADGAFANQGAAYVFAAETGTLLHTLANPSPDVSAYFGTSVTLVGDSVLVGAPLDDGENEDAGRAYLFDLASGVLIRAVTDASADDGANFATASVALENNAAAITTLYDTGGIASIGRYDLDPHSATFGTATLQYDLASLYTHGVASPASGSSLDADADLLLMGDPNAYALHPEFGAAEKVLTGAAALFEANTGALRGVLSDPDAAAGNAFGWSVGLHGRWAIVGAPGSDTAGMNSGAAYLFDAESGDLRRRLLSPKPETMDVLGEGVTVLAAGAFAAATRDDTAGIDAGAVYRFALPKPRGSHKCYMVSGGPTFGEVHQIADDFGDLTLRTTRAKMLCNGVARDGFNDAGPDRHLVCYNAKVSNGTPPVAERTIRYMDTRGARDIVLRSAVGLCMPASTEHGPVSALMDSYTCYSAKPSPGAPRLPKNTFSLSDDLAAGEYTAIKLDRFCTASSLGGVPADAPQDHLACYRIRPVPGQNATTGSTVQAEDAFLSQSLSVLRERSLCFPAILLDSP